MPLYYLPVDSLGTQRPGWLRVGTSPYLNAIADGSYIYTNTNGDEIGNFGFQDLPYGNTGKVESCDVRLRCYQEGSLDDYISVYISPNLGVTWTLAGNITPPASYSFRSLDVLSILDTPTKINNAMMYLVYNRVAAPDNIFVDYGDLSTTVSLIELDWLPVRVRYTLIARPVVLDGLTWVT